ncbi:MAG: DUF4231 domain-containing protein [Chloroflexota bacterium]
MTAKTPAPEAATPQKETPKEVAKEPQKVNYPRVQPRPHGSVHPEDYIAERVNDAIAWYDKNANKYKKYYLQMRATTVIGGALVPVLVNLDFDYIDVLTTILSLIVVLLVSLESVYHFREQWTNYRSTEQSLRREYFLFTSKGGTYANQDNATAYTHFVDRVEEIIGVESSSTLKILSSLAEAKAEEKAKPAHEKK